MNLYWYDRKAQRRGEEKQKNRGATSGGPGPVLLHANRVHPHEKGGKARGPKLRFRTRETRTGALTLTLRGKAANRLSCLFRSLLPPKMQRLPLERLSCCLMPLAPATEKRGNQPMIRGGLVANPSTTLTVTVENINKKRRDACAVAFMSKAKPVPQKKRSTLLDLKSGRIAREKN